jgi:DNA-binding winged helix-turn-helix (wHTH) protein/TolB-like protein
MALPGKLRIGDWRVDPAAGQIVRGEAVVRLDARTLRLLLELAEHAGETVSIDELLDRVWAGVIVTPDSVYQAVAALRRILGDDPKRPRYIATVPRLGYRMVAPVTPWSADPEAVSPPARRSGSRPRVAVVVVAVVVVAVPLAVAVRGWVHGAFAGPAAQAPRSVAVMPFLDLTSTMDHEELADELTEGVIDRLAKDRGVRTPGFRDSFVLKGKHLSPREAARTLGVAYVVDGSLHSSPKGYRVDARLVRADNGFVIWSQGYEGPAGETPRYEDAIASGVGRTLSVSPAP